MTEADVQRLVVAVTVVSTLTGGIDRHIDWVLVARAFPQSQYEAVDLRKKWAPLVKKYKGQLDKLQADFQEAYITAYESGEVDPIDYDDLVHYDWEGLVQWALNILDIPEYEAIAPDQDCAYCGAVLRSYRIFRLVVSSLMRYLSFRMSPRCMHRGEMSTLAFWPPFSDDLNLLMAYHCRPSSSSKGSRRPTHMMQMRRWLSRGFE